MMAIRIAKVAVRQRCDRMSYSGGSATFGTRVERIAQGAIPRQAVPQWRSPLSEHVNLCQNNRLSLSGSTDNCVITKNVI